MTQKQRIVIVISRGFDDERSSVAWSIANASIAADFEVTIFLTASGVDWVRKGASDIARLNPADPPIGEMIRNVTDNGGRILACPPCAKVRGYTTEDLLDGVTIAGAPAMLEVVKQGAATLSF
jgi:predicted peroxiredoxin